MTRIQLSSRAAGFTVIEAMVALIIISVGLLGVAKMQALTIASTSTSRLRSLAAIEGASLASAMYANRAYWGVIPVSTIITIDDGAVTTSEANLKAAVATVSGSANRKQYCQVGMGAPCAPVTMAATDLQQWADDLKLQLPGSLATINCPTVNTPRTCTILINWTEHAVAMTKQQADEEAKRDPSDPPLEMLNPDYKLYVEP
ncbi:MAG: prepilin-type N-terminal cleavage/methylation domain-containing protein [Gammaproteobacteria bacterium]